MPLSINDLEKCLPCIPFWQSHQSSRRQQDEALMNRLCQNALHQLKTSDLQINNDAFFVGGVDVMTAKDNTFRIIEVNGGSTRGFWSLTENQIEAIYNAYLSTLQWAEAPLVVIGHLNYDVLLYERTLLAHRFGPSSEVVILPYHQLIPRLDFKDDWIMLDDQRVGVLIGDGAARRHPEIAQHPHCRTVIVNRIFPITDDKARIYEEVVKHQDILHQYGVKPLQFWRAFSADEVITKGKDALTCCREILLKPHGSSGGCGIVIIQQEDDIWGALQESQTAFAQKFGNDRSPFPYTLSEKIDLQTFDWQGVGYHYDVKVHVIRQNDQIVPIGAKIRLAETPATEKMQINSILTNLTRGGDLAAQRAQGINADTLVRAGLAEADLTNILAAATWCMAGICCKF